MTEALKPCPFCGGEPIVRKAMGEFWLRCEKCHSDGPMVSVEANAVERWNARSEARPQQEAVAWRVCYDFEADDGVIYPCVVPGFSTAKDADTRALDFQSRSGFSNIRVEALGVIAAPPLPVGSAAREAAIALIDNRIDSESAFTISDLMTIKAALASPLILGGGEEGSSDLSKPTRLSGSHTFEQLRTAIDAIDSASASCPIRVKGGRFIERCPKCRATASDGCGPEITALGKLETTVRDFLAAPDQSPPEGAK